MPGPVERILVEKLSFTYRGRDEPALREVDFSLTSGEVHGLAGHNGAGKTTLMLTCAGLVQPQHGRVLGNGCRPVRGTSANEVGLTTERLALPGMFTVAETLELFRAARGLPGSAFGELEEGLELGRWRRRRLSGLSTGQRARVALAVALAGAPPILLLDEPLSGLDPVAADCMVHELARRRATGTAIAVASHDLHMLEWLVDRVSVMGSGRVLRSGTREELGLVNPTAAATGPVPGLVGLYLSLHDARPPAGGDRPVGGQPAREPGGEPAPPAS